MSSSSRISNDRSNSKSTVNETAGSEQPPALEGIIVERPDKSDRLTVGPRTCSEAERATMWLSVDTSVVVELETMR